MPSKHEQQRDEDDVGGQEPQPELQCGVAADAIRKPLDAHRSQTIRPYCRAGHLVLEELSNGTVGQVPERDRRDGELGMEDERRVWRRRRRTRL